MFTPEMEMQQNDAKCGFACDSIVEERTSFTAYGKQARSERHCHSCGGIGDSDNQQGLHSPGTDGDWHLGCGARDRDGAGGIARRSSMVNGFR